MGAGIAVVAACVLTKVSYAQASEEVREAFINLHDDNKKLNCGTAVEWLYPRREQLKDDLVDELYRTDPQGAKAIMFLLLNTRSFKPDERFINTVMTNLGRSARSYVGSRMLFDRPPPSSGAIQTIWEYVDAHFDVFEPLLTQQVSITSDPWILWAIAWEFKSRGTLEQKIDLYTPEVMKKAAASLADDDVSYNASQAIRLFLILGDRSAPILKEAAKSHDTQARSFALATLDALKGNHRAFGYLNANVDLTHPLVSLPGAKDYRRTTSEPEWLRDETERYRYSDKPYP